MSIKNFVMNISGIIAHNDNKVETFGAWFDSAQEALLVGSKDAFATLFPSKASVIQQLLALLSPTGVSFTDPASSKVTASFTMIITGTVAYADNTVKYFSFEVQGNDGVYKHISDGNITFDELISDPDANAIVTKLFEDLIGSTVTITPAIEVSDSSASTDDLSDPSSETSDTSAG